MAWYINLIMYFATWGNSWGEDPGHGKNPRNNYGDGGWDENSSGGDQDQRCCNVFILAKGINISEILWVVGSLILCFINGSLDYSAILGNLIQILYLITECIGIHKKIKCLIIFGCVIRVLAQLVAIIFIIFVFISCFCQDVDYHFRYLFIC